MANSIFFGDDARKKVKSGIDRSVNAIKTTLGGSGKTSIIFEGGLVSITKDGVTCARSIHLADPIENIGSTIIRNVTEKQLEDAGDGTSVTSVLTQKIIELGFKCIERGVNQLDLKKGIDIAVDRISEELKCQSKKVGDDNEKIKNIATISANNDSEIGSLIAEVFAIIGNDGSVFIEESKSFETTTRIDDGYKIDRGYLSPYFCNPETMEAELINPYIIFYEGKIDKFSQVKPVLEKMMELKKRDLLIICDNVEGEALQTLVLNRVKGILNICCVNAPHFGERRKYIMDDMASITGGVYISNEKGTSSISFTDCGTCDKIIVTKNETTIIGSKCEPEVIEKICTQIDSLISKAESEFEVTMLKQRKAKAKGKLAVISVGAPTELEMKEKKDRVDDALRATSCAVEEGIVAGGGIALLRCIEGLNRISLDNKDQQKGVNIIKKALEEPLRQILTNAGISTKGNWFNHSIIDKILHLEPNYGYNVKSSRIEDMFESGIIDATKVVRMSLVNAASVAGTILTAESLIC